MKLNYEKIGNENHTPIIIIHGLFGSISNWRSIAKLLAQHYQVISLDLRNHGNSPWDDSMTYISMVEDVERFIVEHDLIAPHIIGHSMGGKVTMALVQTTRLTLGEAFVIDIAPIQYQHSFDTILTAMNVIDFKQIHSRQQVADRLSETIKDKALKQFLMQNLKHDNNQYAWRLNLQSIISNINTIMDYPSELANQPICRHHITFIAGENSGYINQKGRNHIESLFSNFQIQVIENTGHWLHAEQPEKLLEIIRTQLATVTR